MTDILSEVKTIEKNAHDVQGVIHASVPAIEIQKRNFTRLLEIARTSLARIEELEAERRWIPVEEWMSNSENEMVNVTTWHSNFEEEFPVAYFSNGAWMEWNNGGRPGDDLPKPEFVRPLPSPPEGSAGSNFRKN